MNLTKIIVLILSITFCNYTFAENINIKVTPVKIEVVELKTKNVFDFLDSNFLTTIKPSYKYIVTDIKTTQNDVKYNDIIKKLVYLDVFKNAKKSINLNSKMTSHTFFNIIKQFEWFEDILSYKDQNNKEIRKQKYNWYIFIKW